MMLEAIDRSMRVVVWRQVAPFLPGDPDDHRRMIERVLEDIVLCRSLFLLLELGEGAPPPSPTQRRAAWEVVNRLPANAKAFIITRSAVQRGGITAINWLGRVPTTLHTVATMDDIWSADPSLRSDAYEGQRFERARTLFAELGG